MIRRLLLVALAGCWFCAAQDDPMEEMQAVFQGRKIVVVDPGTTEDGFDPKGRASVCLEGPPRRQCSESPKDFGRYPTLKIVQIDKNRSAMLFGSCSGGASGFEIHYVLLQSGAGAELEDLFRTGIRVSDQSTVAFLEDSAISNGKIFVTADYVWGKDDAQHGSHRYIVTSYVWSKGLDDDRYFYSKEDQFMTAKHYDPEDDDDVLLREKQEILSRLRRAKLEKDVRPPPE